MLILDAEVVAALLSLSLALLADAGLVRCAKDTGLRSPPFHDFAANAVWLQLVLLALDLLVWTQGHHLGG